MKHLPLDVVRSIELDDIRGLESLIALHGPSVLKARDRFGLDALHIALRVDPPSHEAIACLIRHGADPTRGDERGYTALQYTASVGDTETLASLLALGVDANAVDEGGWSALHKACIMGQTEAARLLLQAGADPNIATRSFRENPSPLHLAASHGSDLVRALLEHGAHPRVIGPDGATPLHHGAECDRPEVCRVLIDAGAAVSAQNDEGYTPLDLAINRGECPQTIAVLEAAERAARLRPSTRPLSEHAPAEPSL